jgi:hypothetical protein
VELVITTLRTVYQRAALRTEVRGRRLAVTAYFISQGVWIAAYVALLVTNVLTHHFAAVAVFGTLGAGLFTVLKVMETRATGAHQQQERSPTLATLAALSLAGWLTVYGLFLYAPVYRSRCSGDMCGLDLLGPLYLIVGTGALIGVAAWLGATVRAARRREVLCALSTGLLLPVALGNAWLVDRYAGGSLAAIGSWALFSVVSATLLATSVVRKQTVRRLVAVAGLVLAVALLVAPNLVN